MHRSPRLRERSPPLRRSLSLLAATVAFALAGSAPAHAYTVDHPMFSAKQAAPLGKAPAPSAKWELSELDA